MKESGPTSAPLTTAKPCVDKYSNCAELAKTNCKAHGENCAKVVTWSVCLHSNVFTRVVACVTA